MYPHLIAISGSLKGTTFLFTFDEVTVGREPSNKICLNDPSISRRHCIFKKSPLTQAPQFSIEDLESYNGTFVNGVPVHEQVLAHGDQIALGNVHFLFLTRASDSDPSTGQFNGDDLITRSTVRLLRDEAFYLRPDKVLAALPADDRVARELNTLLTISNTISSIRGMVELNQRLLESILEVIPAERGAILRHDQTLERFVSVSGRNRQTGPDNSIRVSKTIANQVVREVVALLSNDVVENNNLGGTPSLVASRVCSLLCVPLVAFDEPLGIIYLDTGDPAARFDERHLQLLTAIAGIASIAFDNALHFEGLVHENERLHEEIKLDHRMIGESLSMRNVYGLLAKVAPTSSTVLIRGESGTGKELAAHAIHLNSPRATKPFVAINCATLGETLLESELFGHEKGAFTGAITQKRGKLEVADGGTIFLDEVGELPQAIQAKLLRVLQTQEFERVGGTRPIKVDIRLIAATNRNLEGAIKAGEFREDLYYRLNVIAIVMPPLRERREDIPLLASFFVADYSRKCKRKVTGISTEARKLLKTYDWPGNVRELENAIERAVVLGSTNAILPDDLPEAVLESSKDSLPTTYYDAVKQAKRNLIQKALEEARGNYTAAARVLGMHPNNLHRLIRSLDLKHDLQE